MVCYCKLLLWRMSMELTKSQLNYIIAVKQLIGSESSQKYICEYLGVKKSTASIALRNLEDNGYITKQEKAGIKEYFLTDKSWKIIETIEVEKFEFMSLFNGLLGINMDLCTEEYGRVCGDFSFDFIKKLSEIRENGYCRSASAEDSDCGFYGMAQGTYEIPFQVVRGCDGIPSMGDKGFVHPAKLVVDNDRQEIILESKQIYYRSKDAQMLKGKLSELYCQDSDMKWILSEKREENKWVIPVDKVLCRKDKFGRLSLGTVRIKAVATAKKMPESAAEITFNFKLTKKL